MLQTDSWVETEGGCSGPKNVRNQPNRESCGVLMTEQLSNKFANQFDLPLRNLSRYIKEIDNNWDRLTPEQKDIIRNQLENMNSEISSKETFENDSCNYIKYIKEDPKKRVPEILDTMWSPSIEQKALIGSKESEDDIKFYFDKWVSDKSYKMYCNWKNMLITFFTIMLFVLFGALIGYSMK